MVYFCFSCTLTMRVIISEEASIYKEECDDDKIINTNGNHRSIAPVLLISYLITESVKLFLKTPLLLLLLCLIADYSCHLLSSICYCTMMKWTAFKQYLNLWQKPPLLQWLPPLISNRFSNQNQKHPHLFFFLLPESHQMSSKLLKQDSWGERKKKEEEEIYKNIKKSRKTQVGGNKRERTTFYTLK